MTDLWMLLYDNIHRPTSIINIEIARKLGFCIHNMNDWKMYLIIYMFVLHIFIMRENVILYSSLTTAYGKRVFLDLF